MLLNLARFINDNLVFAFLGNLNQTVGFSVPMVAQAPPIQPLPVRPGVIPQVRHIYSQTM